MAILAPSRWGQAFQQIGIGGIGTPFTAVSTVPTWVKVAAGAGIGAAGIYALTKGQSLKQDQTATAPTSYSIYIPEGMKGDINLVNPQGAQIDQTQKAEQKSTDYTGLIIAGIIAIGALLVLGKKK